MGFFLTNWLQSALTPPGTHAAQGQQQQQLNSATNLYNLEAPLATYLQNEQRFQNNQLPNVEQGVNDAYLNTTQGGRNAETQAFGAQANARAANAGAKTYGQFAGNPSLAQGYRIDQQNQANASTNSYADQLNSPAGEQQAWNAYLQANSLASPNYGGIEGLNAGVQGQKPVQVGQGLGGFLGQALGSWASGGLDSVLGGSTPSYTGAASNGPSWSDATDWSQVGPWLGIGGG